MPLNPVEIALIVLILVLLFSAKRIPEMGRSLGRGMREFKEAISESANEEPEKAEASNRIDLSSPRPPEADADPTSTKEPERVSG
jgi:sec-independent protein translocase protein TatA